MCQAFTERTSHLTRLNDKNLNARLADTERKTQASSEKQDALIEEVRDRLEENNRLIKSSKTTLIYTLGLNYIMKLGGELKSFAQRIL